MVQSRSIKTNNRYVSPGKGATVNCQEDKAGCAEALEEAKKSGEPTKKKLSHQGEANTAVSVTKAAGGNKFLYKFLSKNARKK